MNPIEEAIKEISNDRIKVSQALEIVNLDEREQKIVCNAILDENLTVRDIRKLTKNLKIDNPKRTRRKHGEGSSDIYSTEILNNPTDEYSSPSYAADQNTTESTLVSYFIV